MTQLCSAENWVIILRSSISAILKLYFIQEYGEFQDKCFRHVLTQVILQTRLDCLLNFQISHVEFGGIFFQYTLLLPAHSLNPLSLTPLHLT